MPALLTRLPSMVPESLLQRVRRAPLRTVAAASLLLLLTLLYFWPFVLRGEIIAPTDLLLGYAPWSSLATDEFRIKNVLRSDVIDYYLPVLNQYRGAMSHGDFPLWTPLWSQGQPFASQLLNSFFHPLTAVLLLFPLPQGFSLLIMAKLFVSGLFMYLFLRRLGVAYAGSLLGGVAYMFSGFNIVWLMWQHTLVSSFAPLLFLQSENLLRKPTLGNSALLSLVIAIMLLGGFPAVAGYFFYAVGLYFIVRLAEIVLRGRLAWGALWLVGVFCLSFALAAGLAAFQALPTLEFADFLDIADQRSGRSLGSVPISQAIQLVFPNFLGNQVFGNGPRGWGNFNETSGYVGIVTLIIAFFGFFVGIRRQRVPAAFFGVLALLSLLVIYEDTGPLRSLVRHLPVFDLNPNNRMLSLFGFAVAGAAAFGFDELLQVRPTGWRRRAVPLALAGSAALLAGVVAFLASKMTGRRALLADLLDKFPIMDFQAFSLLDFESFRLATVAFGVGVVLIFVILLAAHFRGFLPPTAVAAGVLALVFADLFVFAYRQNPTVPNEYFYPETPGIEFLETNLLPYERMAPFDGTFMVPGTQAFYGLNGAFSLTLYSERHRELILAFSDNAFAGHDASTPQNQSTRFDSPIIDLLGIKFVIVKPEVDLFEAQPALQARYKVVYANPDEIKIYENRQFAPAFLVPNVRRENDPSMILDKLQRSDFDPHAVAYVEEAPPTDWSVVEETSTAATSSVTVSQYESDSVTYVANRDSKALLVTPELYYPGWDASVDGEATKIYRTNYIFRGVFVDAGRHTVRFEYRPSSFRWGLIISVVSLSGVAALITLDWTARRRRSTPNDA